MRLYILFLLIFAAFSCQYKAPNDAASLSSSLEQLSTANLDKEIACKLTAPELQARKEGALASLRGKIQETVETANGYAYKFAGSDETLGELMVFIQSERQCCDFFTFKLGVQDAHSPIWLEISGNPAAKSFIKNEMALAK